jgi:hypothetical protein
MAADRKGIGDIWFCKAFVVSQNLIYREHTKGAIAS